MPESRRGGNPGEIDEERSRRPEVFSDSAPPIKHERNPPDSSDIMAAETINQYLRTQVLTAGPAELRMLLIEGAIRFTHQGRDGLAEKNYEKSYEGLTQAKAIIMELMNGLRPEVQPELCAKLSSLYTFMYRRLVDANLEKNPAIVGEVLKLLDYERETWSLLLGKLAEEKLAMRPENGPTPDAPPHEGARLSSICIEG